MKLRLLSCLIAFALLFSLKNANAANYTWTGSGTDTKWETPANWSGGTTFPGAGDDVTIPSTTNKPTIDVSSACASITISGTTTNTTITLSAALTVSGGLTVNGGASLTFAGTGSATFGGASSLSHPCTLTIGSGNTITFNSVALTIVPGSSLVNNGSLKINSGSLVNTGGASSSITNSGTITMVSSTLDIEAGGALINSGTVTTSANSFVILNGNPSPITNNVNSIFNASATAFTMAPGSSITNTGGAFNLSASSSITTSGNGFKLINQNSGTTIGTFSLDNSSISTTGSISITITNSGTFTANDGSSITIPSNATTSSITNSGTFFAGTPGSACTLNLNTVFASISNSATGLFYVGSTSVLNATGGATVKNASGGTFTIQSDINGSGTIGATTGSSPFTGIYNVQRYLSGGSPIYRGYRLLSSPVATSATSGIYSLNYVQLSALITGTGGAANGFDQAGNPTFYLYRDNIAFSNASFTSGNFRGVSSINNSPTYTINGDPGNFQIPVGNGFLFFDRGDRTTNLANKYTPGTSAESITLTATGTLNTGQITLKLWFTPTLSTLDYTAVAGNSTVLGFALAGNPYASSIDWDQYNTTSSTTGIYAPNVGASTYMLDPISKNYSVYQAGHNGVATIVTANANIISSGQGFFVQAIPPLSPSSPSPQLIFNESAKINLQVSTTTSNLLLRSAATATAPADQYLHLKLAQDSVNTDGILIMFNSNATAQFATGEDARYMTGSGSVSLSSMSADSIPLAINTLALPKQSQTIPLNVSAIADGLYQLNMDAVKNIPALFDIWLMDSYKKDSLDIKHNPAYKFNIYLSDAASYGSNRFSLVIRQNPALGVHLLSFTAAKATAGAQVVWKTENEENYTNFTVERSTGNGLTFEVLGGFASSALGTYSFTDKNPPVAADQYRLKMEDLNGTITYSQVVTLMYANAKTLSQNGISLYPNPAKSTLNLNIAQAANTPADASVSNNSVSSNLYNIRIINNSGALVETATTNISSWQTDISKLIPGIYVIQVINNNDNSVIGKSTFIKL